MDVQGTFWSCHLARLSRPCSGIHPQSAGNVALDVLVYGNLDQRAGKCRPVSV